MIRGKGKGAGRSHEELASLNDAVEEENNRWRESPGKKARVSVPPDFLPLPKPRYVDFTGSVDRAELSRSRYMSFHLPG